jgi:hypothetical protein
MIAGLGPDPRRVESVLAVKRRRLFRILIIILMKN